MAKKKHSRKPCAEARETSQIEATPRGLETTGVYRSFEIPGVVAGRIEEQRNKICNAIGICRTVNLALESFSDADAGALRSALDGAYDLLEEILGQLEVHQNMLLRPSGAPPDAGWAHG